MNVDSFIPNNHTKFVWKLRNYAYYENLGAPVNSPDFYSSIRGQCCCLLFQWKKDKTLGLFLRFRLGNHEPEDEMQMDVTFSVTSSKGITIKRLISAKEIRDQKETFTIKPGELQSMGRGPAAFLKYPALADFIIDDVLTVTCELTGG